jgi:NitT/TauT family transport system substrate-binding protein
MKFFSLLIFLSTLSIDALGTDLALNWKPEPQFGGFYQAQIDGEFKKLGLDVKILEGGSGTPTVQMLANGKVDFAIVSAEEILQSNEHNPKNQVVGLFAAFQTNPQILMCRKENSFHSMSDIFKSEVTLAWQNGLTYAAFLKKKYAGSKVKFVPYLGGITPFLNDAHFCQQGFATSEPLAAEQQGHGADVFLVAKEGFNPYTTVLATRADVIQKNSKLAKDMTSAVRLGWTHYLQNPQKANEFMSSLNKGMSPDTFAKSAAAQKDLIASKLELGKMEASRWQTLIEQLKGLGVIKSDLKAQDQFLTY